MSRVPVLVLVGVLASCGEYPSGNVACQAVPYEGRCGAFADAEFERERRCGELDPNDAEAVLMLARDWTCGGLRPVDAELAGLLAAKRIRYDARETGCAVEALRDLPCGASNQAFGEVYDRIFNPLEPATPVGEACTDSIQCVDSYCPPRVCGRTCTPFPARGEACGDDVPCGPGDACSAATGTCVRLPDLGETCSGSCRLPYTCLSPGDGNPNRCFEYVRPGQACGGFQLCSTGCVDVDPVNGTGTCADEPGAGEACQTSCAHGLVCEPATWTCVAGIHPGGVCDPSEGWRCLFGPFVTCDPHTWRCTLLPGIGEPCTDAGVLDCRVGVCADGVCRWPEPETDVPCGQDWNCGDDRICEDGRCVEGCR